MQGLLSLSARKAHRARAFTLVEVMVVVVIIGLLAAMAMPIYRHITLRSKATAVVNDFRTFSTALITYSIQNGHWPADGTPGVIPPEMVSLLPTGFSLKTPIGGVYKWNFDVSADGITAKAAILIETANGETMTDDADLVQMVDQLMDDGSLSTGVIQLGSTNSLVYIIEK